MFEIMFWFGVSFVVLSVILGQVLDSACCYTPTGIFSMTYLFQPLPILLFITFTGGAGLIFSEQLLLLPLFLIWGLALGSGFLGAYAITRWVFTPIFHLENTSSTTDLGLYGTAFILERDMKKGDIVGHGIAVGLTYQSRVIALHENEQDFLTRGTKVYVLSIKEHVLFVGRGK